MLRALDPNIDVARDSYWAMLEGAITNNRYIEKHRSLNEICLSTDVIGILRTVAQDPTLTDSRILKREIDVALKSFAYGEL